MYILEGNIGTGKSTFLKLIADHLPYVTIEQEPVDQWQSNKTGESLLAQFYQDPKRWSYTMETFTMACRVKEHILEQRCSSSYHIAERSIYSGHYCFAQNGYENGFMTNLEWNIYNQWFSFLVQQKCTAPFGFIYLKADPDIAYERIQKRGRGAEKTITKTYLQQIESCHERFLVQKENVLPELKEVPVLVLDCNEEFETNCTNLEEHIAQVDEFLMQTQPKRMYKETQPQK